MKDQKEKEPKDSQEKKSNVNSVKRSYRNIHQLSKLEGFPFTLVANPEEKNKRGLCCACRCTNKRAGNSRFCSKHGSRVRVWSQPEREVYNNLKGNAKRRGKEFSLTFEEFLSFLEANPDYMDKRGRKVKSLQIDRIDVKKGYSADNIQAITLRENIWKRDNIDYVEDCEVFGEGGGVPF